LGIDLVKQQGNDTYELPVPATYVVDQHKKIIFAFIDSDYSKRLEPHIAVEKLKSILK